MLKEKNISPDSTLRSSTLRSSTLRSSTLRSSTLCSSPPWSVRYAAHILKQGGIIAYPTEAVFGLGCLADNTAAIKRLLELKQRPAHKGLILLASDLLQIEAYISPLKQTIREKITASWPGPTTWIVPTPSTTSSLIKGQFNTIAIRISAHPMVRALCRQCQSPIISTSANITGKRMSYSPFDVRLHFKDQLDYILYGALGSSNKPTMIKDALTDKIIRY